MFKKLLSFINLAQYVLLVVATLCVIALQFVPQDVNGVNLEVLFVIMAHAFYFAGFLAMSVMGVINCLEVFAASKRYQEANMTALVSTTSKEVVSPKREKVWAIALAVFAISLCLFTLATLIGYLVKYTSL